MTGACEPDDEKWWDEGVDDARWYEYEKYADEVEEGIEGGFIDRSKFENDVEYRDSEMAIIKLISSKDNDKYREQHNRQVAEDRRQKILDKSEAAKYLLTEIEKRLDDGTIDKERIMNDPEYRHNLQEVLKDLQKYVNGDESVVLPDIDDICPRKFYGDNGNFNDNVNELGNPGSIPMGYSKFKYTDEGLSFETEEQDSEDRAFEDMIDVDETENDEVNKWEDYITDENGNKVDIEDTEEFKFYDNKKDTKNAILERRFNLIDRAQEKARKDIDDDYVDGYKDEESTVVFSDDCNPDCGYETEGEVEDVDFTQPISGVYTNWTPDHDKNMKELNEILNSKVCAPEDCLDLGEPEDPNIDWQIENYKANQLFPFKKIEYHPAIKYSEAIDRHIDRMAKEKFIQERKMKRERIIDELNKEIDVDIDYTTDDVDAIKRKLNENTNKEKRIVKMWNDPDSKERLLNSLAAPLMGLSSEEYEKALKSRNYGVSTGTGLDKVFEGGISFEDAHKECKQESDEQSKFQEDSDEIEDGIVSGLFSDREKEIYNANVAKDYYKRKEEVETMNTGGAGQMPMSSSYNELSKAATARPMGLKKKSLSPKSYMTGTIAAFMKDVPEDFEIPEGQLPLLERYVDKSLIPYKNMNRFLAIDDIVKYSDHACVVSAIDYKDYTVSLYDVESQEGYGWMRAVGLDVVLMNHEWAIVKGLIQNINDVRRAEVEKKFKPGMMIKLTKDFTYQFTNMFGQLIKVIIKEKTEGILVKILSGDFIKVAFYGDGVHDVEIDSVEITNPTSAAWDNVILPDSTKEQILAVAKYNKNDIDKFDVGINKEDWHGLYPHLLLYGPPGNGKTAISMALGKKIGRPVLSIKGAQCHNVAMLGDTLVKAAEWNAIVFIDEFFLMSPDCMSAMLTSLEQIDTPIIMASNSTEMTKAMASRIPIKLKIDYPDKESMKEIWKIHLGESAKSVDVDMLVNEYKQISGRDIKSAVVMSIARIAERQSQLPEVMAGMAVPMITTELLVDQLEEHKKFENDRKSYDPNA